MTLQFDPSFSGKTVAMKIYAFDKSNVQTGFSNASNIIIPTSQTPGVTMPVLPANVTTNSAGIATVTFTSGTLTASQLNDLWAEVKYDNKTEYWDLDPSLLAADGRSMTLQFDTPFNSKTVQMKIYGFDKQNVQTGFSNSVSILVNISTTSVTMPTLPSSMTTNNTGLAKITFTSGTLFANQLNDLWAQVTYDNKTEYWDFDPAMLSSDGTYMNVQFTTAFDDKTVLMRIYGFDKNNRQTALSNPISILVNISN